MNKTTVGMMLVALAAVWISNNVQAVNQITGGA
jgi:hypothetical protein